jgi:hypothetical protein
MEPGPRAASRSAARPSIPALEIILAAVLTLVGLAWLASAEGAELRLAWADNSGGSAAVRIERRLASDVAFAQVGVQPPGVASYTDATVVSGATYCYRLRAFNQMGESSYSNEACGTPAAVLGVMEVMVDARGSGTGTVTRHPGGSTRAVATSASYPVGTIVTLEASPDPGSVFAGWSGGGCSGTEPCTVTGNGPIVVTATFEGAAGAAGDRPALLEPGEATAVAVGNVVTFVWTGLAGAASYGFEFTGPNRQFANANGSVPDAINGFGGAGGGFLVSGTTLTLRLPATVPPGAYQVRVIGVSSEGLVGTFSDAVTIVVSPGAATAQR